MSSKKKPIGNFSNNSHCMDGLYEFHDELGSGGFGKVKLATHLLSGEKVAIKIIDKKAIGDDLPRVTTELEALKQLAHQNICRLFQYVETEEKFYIVMEYCNGGEMFDYIVKKERLEESEARHFFRQLVQAMAYVHSLGFAHRDLKPENLLLKEDLQLKVIDFGLCAKPRNGLNRPLETCCGSPAYAAPELIQSSAYYGNEADIWSMGVLLYALLCGALPFEDENMPKLYKKILQGQYYEPPFLSNQSKDLLRELLRVNPKYRITVQQLLVHPWLNKNYHQPLKWKSVYDVKVIDEEIAREMAFFHQMSYANCVLMLKEWRFDYFTATYLVLLQKKERKQSFVLPMYRERIENVVHSPTIHASLEQDLNRYGVTTKQNKFSSSDYSERRQSPLDKSYAKAIDFGSPSVLVHSPLPKKSALDSDAAVKRPYPGTPSLVSKSTTNKVCSNKENQRPATMRVRGPIVVNPPSSRQEEIRPTSVYRTPKKNPFINVLSPCPTPYQRPKSIERDGYARAAADVSSPISSNCSPSTPTGPTDRIARSQVKTSRLRTRVFKSLERNKERVINLLTPRKMKNEGPTKLKHIDNMVNVSITSSNDPHQVRLELLRVLNGQGISPVQNGWKISGSKRSAAGVHTTVELEVVLIENLNNVGVKRTRLNGDSFLYKKLIEEILNLANL